MTRLSYHDFVEDDWPEIWRILEPTFRAGESYPCAIDITETAAHDYWIKTPSRTFVLRTSDNELGGTFYIRPDQGGLGDHICNCGYIVNAAHQGQGFAVEMCRYSQKIARADGFLGMKFNLVVASNKPAISAWKKCGMEIIGTTPNAFRHKTLGLVDAHIMYKAL